MKAETEKKSARQVRSLGNHLVIDSDICHDKPTFRDTRILVADALEMLADGMTPEQVRAAYNDEFAVDAIREAMLLARDLLSGKNSTRFSRRVVVAA